MREFSPTIDKRVWHFSTVILADEITYLQTYTVTAVEKLFGVVCHKNNFFFFTYPIILLKTLNKFMLRQNFLLIQNIHFKTIKPIVNY